MPPHITKEGTEIGKPLPQVTWHFVNQRSLDMYDFIMRQREHKVFRVSVHKRKGNIVMVVASMNWIKMDIFKHIMHPTHIPFEGKAQATHICWTRYERPGTRFFRNRNGSW